MEKEMKTAVYDRTLRLEAYRFTGIGQPFPNHFHEYYVIGFVEDGRRILSCKNKEYEIKKGNVVLFHPGDNHACVQSGSETFDWRGFHISKRVMRELAEEVTGKRELPGFSQNVIDDEEILCYVHPLHEMVMNGRTDFEKEENLLLLIAALLQNYGRSFSSCVPECCREIEKACEFMQRNFQEKICLDEICRCAGLGKSTLLRAFTKSKGVTPYRYLEALRINEAKRLLSEGVKPAEAAVRTGFSDQSHFTNYFNCFIGLSPGVYREIFFDRDKEREAEDGK